MTLITFAFCEKEGIVGVTGLEVLGVSTVDGFDVMSDDDLGVLDSLFQWLLLRT